MEEIEDFLTFFMKITLNVAHPNPYLSLNLK